MVLRLLKSTRLVSLTGEPGIGKTAVGKFIANYIKIRKGEFIKNGVVFLNVINCSSIQMLKHKFVNVFSDCCELKLTKKADKRDTNVLFKKVLKIISNLEFLLIIDDAEDLLRTSKKMLKEFIEILFEASSTIKILLTSKIELISFLGGFTGIKGGTIKLKNLSLPASEKLLQEKAGKMIKRDEKSKLLKMEPVRVHGGIKNAYQHLFEVILSGHPIAIGLAANLYSNSSLEFLYETLAKSSLLNTLSQGTIGKATINEKLRFSLNLTLRIIRDKNVLYFFNLMGYFPGGIEEKIIDLLWPHVKKSTTKQDWKHYYHFLVNASFMTKKKIKVHKEWREVYSLVPMLKTLAEESRNTKERKDTHNIVTRFFVEVLDEIMKQNSTDGTNNEKLIAGLWYHEMNIWDCIYRALEIKNLDSVKTGSYKLQYYDTQIFSSDKLRNIGTIQTEESYPVEDSDYEQILENCKELGDEEINENEEKIINKLIETLKPTLVPQKKEFKDKDLMKMFPNDPSKQNLIKNVIKKPTIKRPKEPSSDDVSNLLQRNMDKKLKKKVNIKVMNMIQQNEELNKINKPKEKIYKKIEHKIYEAQEEHMLYNGEATKDEVNQKNGVSKTVNWDARVLILYISNLILFSKKTDAIKAIDEYGKYFYDKSL